MVSTLTSVEWTLDFISMKSSYLVTHSSHFLRIKSVAISKQVVVSEVKASVLIQSSQNVSSFLYSFLFLKNCIYYKKQISQT